MTRHPSELLWVKSHQQQAIPTGFSIHIQEKQSRETFPSHLIKPGAPPMFLMPSFYPPLPLPKAMMDTEKNATIHGDTSIMFKCFICCRCYQSTQAFSRHQRDQAKCRSSHPKVYRFCLSNR
jgi:hypothetical protein